MISIRVYLIHTNSMWAGEAVPRLYHFRVKGKKSNYSNSEGALSRTCRLKWYRPGIAAPHCILLAWLKPQSKISDTRWRATFIFLRHCNFLNIFPFALRYQTATYHYILRAESQATTPIVLNIFYLLTYSMSVFRSHVLELYCATEKSLNSSL